MRSVSGNSGARTTDVFVVFPEMGYISINNDAYRPEKYRIVIQKNLQL